MRVPPPLLPYVLLLLTSGIGGACSPLVEAPFSPIFYDVTWTSLGGEVTLNAAQLTWTPAGHYQARRVTGEILQGDLAGIHLAADEVEVEGRRLTLTGGVRVSGRGYEVWGEELSWRVGSPRGELVGGVRLAWTEDPEEIWEGERLVLDPDGLELQALRETPPGVEGHPTCVKFTLQGGEIYRRPCDKGAQGGMSP